MIKTTTTLLFELQDYHNPQTKIRRLVKEKRLFPIRRGLYETQAHVSPHLLAGSIYGPSYISFASALSYHGLIPERVYTCTSATMKKNRSKLFATPFGTFHYRDIPSEAYPFGAIWVKVDENYSFLIASPEKALCDMLYIQQPIYSISSLQELLFENLRMEEEDFFQLNREDLLFLCPKYHKNTLYKLAEFLQKKG